MNLTVEYRDGWWMVLSGTRIIDGFADEEDAYFYMDYLSRCGEPI